MSTTHAQPSQVPPAAAPPPHAAPQTYPTPASQRSSRAAPLPRRMRTIIDHALACLPPHGRVIEIGFDRARILLAALRERPDARGLGIEILPDAANLALPLDLAPRVTLLTGDGLHPLAHSHLHDSVLILAGLGGSTLAELLTEAPCDLHAFAGIVLCPSHFEATLRPTLATLGLAPAAESLVLDRGRTYEVLTARPASLVARTPHDEDPATALWGPRLFDRQDPLLYSYLTAIRARFARAFANDFHAYLTRGKAAHAHKLAQIDALLARITDPADPPAAPSAD